MVSNGIAQEMARLEALAEERREVEAKLAALEERQKELAAETQRLETDLASAETQVTELEEELEALHRRQVAADDRRGELRLRLDEAVDRRSELDAEVQDLLGDRDRLEADFADLYAAIEAAAEEEENDDDDDDAAGDGGDGPRPTGDDADARDPFSPRVSASTSAPAVDDALSAGWFEQAGIEPDPNEVAPLPPPPRYNVVHSLSRGGSSGIVSGSLELPDEREPREPAGLRRSPWTWAAMGAAIPLILWIGVRAATPGEATATQPAAVAAGVVDPPAPEDPASTVVIVLPLPSPPEIVEAPTRRPTDGPKRPRKKRRAKK